MVQQRQSAFAHALRDNDLAKGVGKLHLVGHGPDRPVDDIHSARHDHTADKLDSVSLGLYVNLIRM